MGAPVNVKARPGEAGAMDGFQLSPGITPFLTDLFVSLVPLALGLELGLFRGRGRWSPALAGGLLSMALVKIATDPTDLPDLLVALWGAATAHVYGYAGRRAGGGMRRPRRADSSWSWRSGLSVSGCSRRRPMSGIRST